VFPAVSISRSWPTSNQIDTGDRDAVACGAPPAPLMHPHQVMDAHQAGDAFAAAAHSAAGQLGVHSRRPIGASRALIDLRDRRGQRGVGYFPRRGRPVTEGIEPRAGDAEDSAEPLDAIGVTMIGDESEAADRIVSWAK
jgi:hypothetical protein